VGRFVFVSSGGVVYGEPEVRPTPESAPKVPESPYGVTKLAGEQYLYYYHRVHGLEYAALRYSNVYGPRQDPHGEAGVVAIFSTRLVEERPITIFGDGEQTRDYVYVGDVVAANMLVSDLDLPRATSLDDRGFNVGTGVETSVNDLARILTDAAGTEVPIEHAEAARRRAAPLQPGRGPAPVARLGAADGGGRGAGQDVRVDPGSGGIHGLNDNGSPRWRFFIMDARSAKIGKPQSAGW
jgi:nucleoside-diphosphate-sugar epimerase